MSSITLSPSIAVNSSSLKSSRPVDWGLLTRVGLAATFAATIANVLVYFAGDAIIGYNATFVELGSALGIAIFTVTPAIIATLLYAVLLKTTNRPARVFTIVSAIVFVLTAIPDLTYIPGQAGSSNSQTATLLLMHVVAAVLIVRVLTTFPRTNPE